jgi:predicted dehydrogenase
MTLPVDATIRGLIARGQLGALREICVTHTNSAYADEAASLTWRQDIELSGHNTLTLGIYYEAVLRWMREDVHVTSASAAIFTPVRLRADGSTAAVRIPESLTVLGRYDGGCRLIMHLSGVETSTPRNEVRINGTRGGLRLAVATGELWWIPAGGQETRHEIAAANGTGWRVEADFIDSIRRGTPVQLTDFATGVRTMRFTDEVWQAWQGSVRPD